MKVHYTLPALADLEAILDHVAVRSPQGAKRIHSKVKAAIAHLADHPHVGVRTEDPTIRRVTTSPYPYLVFYEVGATEIIIHAIRHGARDPRSMPGSPPRRRQ